MNDQTSIAHAAPPGTRGVRLCLLQRLSNVISVEKDLTVPRLLRRSVFRHTLQLLTHSLAAPKHHPIYLDYYDSTNLLKPEFNCITSHISGIHKNG